MRVFVFSMYYHFRLGNYETIFPLPVQLNSVMSCPIIVRYCLSVCRASVVRLGGHLFVHDEDGHWNDRNTTEEGRGGCVRACVRALCCVV